MTLLQKLIVYPLVIVLLLAGIIIAAPLYMPALLSRILADQGLVVQVIQVRIPGASTWVLPELQVHNRAGIRFKAKTVLLHYRWSELLRGKLQSIDVKSLDIETGRAVTTSEQPGPRFPLLAQWRHSLPLHRITVDSGTIDGRMQIDTLDLQKIDNDLVLAGRFVLGDSDIELNGSITAAQAFQLQLAAPRGKIEVNGNFDNTVIQGSGTSQFDLALIGPWLPPQVQDVNGEVQSDIKFALQNNNRNIDLDADVQVQGELQSPTYFDRLQLNQAVHISGTSQSPNLNFKAGDSLRIEQLRKPINLQSLTVALTADLAINDVLNNFNVAEQTQVRLLTDRDAIDVVFRGQDISANGRLGSVRPRMQVSSQLQLQSMQPLRVRVLTGSTVFLGQVDKLGDTQLQLAADWELESVDGGLNQTQPLQLQLLSSAMTAELHAQGKLSPLDLRLSLSSDDVVWEGDAYGPAGAELTAVATEAVTIKGGAKFLATEIRIDSTINPDTLRGNFSITAEQLSQLNQALSPQCIEITSGRFAADGTVNFNDEPRGQGNLTVENLSVNVQDRPFNDIQFAGTWTYNQTAGFTGMAAAGDLEIPVLGLGIEVDNVFGKVRWRGDSIYIDRLQGQTLGGSLHGENLQWQLGQPRNELLLYLQAIDLRQLVALEDYQGLEVSGRINMALPLRINSGRVQVVGGKIEAVQPGGEIHLPVDGSNRSGAQKEAFEALRNFHYQVLSGDLSGPIALDPDGLLVSRLTLRGMNPDTGRQVSLNLTIEQNTYPIFQTLALFNRINRIGQCSPQ